MKPEGGCQKKGKTPEQVEFIRKGAQAVIATRVCSIVFESVVGHTAKSLTQSLSTSIIEIVCGEGNCDGKIAARTDLHGSCPRIVPPFATPEADVAAATRTAVARYVSRVRETD